MNRGRVLAAAAAFFVLVAACAPPPTTIRQLPTPTPPPSPTPTTAMAAAAPTFHVGEVGVAYTPVSFTATGGLAPYKWSVASGALPGGLTLGSDGSISGTPTAGGDFTFTIGVADSGTQSSSLDGKISIADALTAHLRPECSSYCNVELGCTTACGNFGTLTGGVGPFAFSVVGGDVPSGTSVVGFSLSGTFRGGTGWVQFTVQASDALGATTTISPKFWMYPHISLQGSATCYGNYLTGCTARLAIGGGVPGTSVSVRLLSAAQNPNANPPNNNPGICWTLANTAPPAKSSLGVGGGYVNVYIPPAPEPAADGYGAIWTIQVTASDLCGPGTYCATNAGIVTIGVQCG